MKPSNHSAFSGNWNLETGSYPVGMGNHPVVNVDWNDAQAYCEWAGFRLPTVIEWEKASRGVDGRIFPWGDQWRPGHANTWENHAYQTLHVETMESGASPYGVFDMVGNVMEWCADTPDDVTHRIVKGGNWVTNWYIGQCAWQSSEPSTLLDAAYGFRCAKDATEAEKELNLEQFMTKLERSPVKTGIHALDQAIRGGAYRWFVICDQCGRVQGYGLSRKDAEAVLSVHRSTGCRCGSKEFVVQEI